MKRFLFTLFLLSCGFLFSNSKANAMGIFYTNSTYPVTATGVSVEELSKLKKGSASAHNILYFVEVGDASIDEAIKKADIKKISYIDVNQKSIFIFWSKVTVNVYGE